MNTKKRKSQSLWRGILKFRAWVLSCMYRHFDNDPHIIYDGSCFIRMEYYIPEIESLCRILGVPLPEAFETSSDSVARWYLSWRFRHKTRALGRIPLKRVKAGTRVEPTFPSVAGTTHMPTVSKTVLRSVNGTVHAEPSPRQSIPELITVVPAVEPTTECLRAVAGAIIDNSF